MRTAIAFVVLLASAGVAAQADQGWVSPRLRDGDVSRQIPPAFGGGAVVLELTVDAKGAVRRAGQLCATPPFTDFMMNAVGTWRFTPATAVVDGQVTPMPAPVLVVAVFRPPQVFAGPPQLAPHLPAPRVPMVDSVIMPAYPPTATGDGVVIVEIEMNGDAGQREYRVVGPASGFDSAALDAVRAWQFRAPRGADAGDRFFAYAVLGFRSPLGPVIRPR